MIESTETAAAAVLAGVGVVGTLGWYALAWYGIGKLNEIRDAIDRSSSNSD